ncbi:MAG: IS1 family transposase, partial [Rhodobacteraceae bacterium]|nr:IS1 family transposase [Paracoccaceae bacterium]
MDRKAFWAWLSEIGKSIEARTVEVGEVLACRPAGEAPVAAVKLGIGEDRACPHCGAQDAVVNGKSRGMQRCLCQSCQRSFGSTTGTAVNGLHRKYLWLTFGECRTNGDTVKALAKRFCASLPYRD